jgi:hypothetical protein
MSWHMLVCCTLLIEIFTVPGSRTFFGNSMFPWKIERTRNRIEWFMASATKYLRTAVFWVVTRRVVVISYRRFGTTYGSHPTGSRILNPAFSESEL